VAGNTCDGGLILLATRSYNDLATGFRWDIPARLNMATQACFDWFKTPDRVVVIDLPGGTRRDVTCGVLAAMIRSLAVYLRRQGVVVAAVIGVPDPERSERVQANVVLKPGFQVSSAKLKTHVKTPLSAYLVPREIRFETELPMTVTGQIIRKELKRRAKKEMSE